MANQKQLEEKGYCYPVFSFDYYRVMEKRNGHFLAGSLWDGEGNHDREKEQKYFREGMNRVKDLFQEFDGVILSDEQIWKNTYEERAGLWEELKEEGKKGGFAVKIIVYIRRQDYYVSSLWNQSVKTAIRKEISQMTFEEYLQNIPPAEQLDYDTKLKSITDVLGKENVTVRVFEREKFKECSLYADFLQCVGLTFTDDFEVEIDVRNSSLMGNSHEIKRVLNSIPQMGEMEMNNFFRKILYECSDISRELYPCSMFSREETEEFLAKYEEGNRRVLLEYFGSEGWDTLFDEQISDKEKWQRDNPYMEDDIIRFMGMSVVMLKQDIRALKKEVAEVSKIAKYLHKLRHPFSFKNKEG